MGWQQHSSPAVEWTDTLVLIYLLNLSRVSSPSYTLVNPREGATLIVHRWAYELERVTGQGGGHHREPTAKCPDQGESHLIGGCRLWPGLERCVNRQTSLPKTRITRTTKSNTIPDRPSTELTRTAPPVVHQGGRDNCTVLVDRTRQCVAETAPSLLHGT